MPPEYCAQQSYYLRASPKKTIRALTEPKLLVKWFLSDAAVDARKGGKFVFDWMGGYHMTGRLLRFKAGKGVTFLSTDKLRNGRVVKTEAAFSVRRKRKGAILELRHSGFTDPEHFAECSSRWAYYLMNLKSVLDQGHDLRSKLDW